MGQFESYKDDIIFQRAYKKVRSELIIIFGIASIVASVLMGAASLIGWDVITSRVAYYIINKEETSSFIEKIVYEYNNKKASKRLIATSSAEARKTPIETMQPAFWVIVASSILSDDLDFALANAREALKKNAVNLNEKYANLKRISSTSSVDGRTIYSLALGPFKNEQTALQTEKGARKDGFQSDSYTKWITTARPMSPF